MNEGRRPADSGHHTHATSRGYDTATVETDFSLVIFGNPPSAGRRSSRDQVENQVDGDGASRRKGQGVLVSSWWIVAITALGAVLGAGAAQSLRRAGYRLPVDEPRLGLTRPPLTVVRLAVVRLAVVGLAGAYAALTAGAKTPQLLPAALVFALAGVWVVWIDVDVHRIPNPVLAVAAPAVAVTGWAGAVAMGEEWARIWTSLAAAAVLVAFYYLLAYFGDLGLGDVRLAGVAGLLLGVYGWSTVLRGTVAAIMLGGLAAIFLLAAGRRQTSDLAFGPAIVVGTLIAVTLA